MRWAAVLTGLIVALIAVAGVRLSSFTVLWMSLGGASAGRELLEDTVHEPHELVRELARRHGHGRRLLDGPPAPLPWATARVAIAGAALTALLFFVV